MNTISNGFSIPTHSYDLREQDENSPIRFIYCLFSTRKAVCGVCKHFLLFVVFPKVTASFTSYYYPPIHQKEQINHRNL